MTGKEWTRILLEGAAGIGMVLSLANFPGTTRAIGTLAGQSPSCDDGKDKNVPVVVYGAGSQSAAIGRLSAAGKAFEKRETDLIFLTGDVNDPAPSTRSQGKEWLMENFSIPENRIVPVFSKNTNTATDSAALVIRTREMNISRVKVADGDPEGNGRRAVLTICNWGIKASLLNNENINSSLSDHEFWGIVGLIFDYNGDTTVIRKRVELLVNH